MVRKRVALCLVLGACILALVWFVLSFFFAGERKRKQPPIDPKKTVGLVLSGGCARGAYEVGVWKCLVELGIAENVRVFSGTSIGAINAALFAYKGDPACCENVWRRNVAEVFELDDEECWNALNELAIDSMMMGLDAFCRARGRVDNGLNGNSAAAGILDASRLRRLLRTNLPVRWGRGAPFVYATALDKETKSQKRFCVNGKNAATYVEYLMASAAVPVLFSSVCIDGRQYIDGGVAPEDAIDNVPVAPIRDSHPEVGIVIVVYLGSEKEIEQRRTAVDFPNGKLVEIIPSQDLGKGVRGALDFREKKISSMILLGYEDAMRILSKEVPELVKQMGRTSLKDKEEI